MEHICSWCNKELVDGDIVGTNVMCNNCGYWNIIKEEDV
jgi:DNA-directed RNA polymerase subunit RPC12/RpoP